MANRLKLLVEVIASDDAVLSNDPQDAIKSKNIIEDLFLEINRKKLAIADSVTDQVITLTTTTAKYLIIQVDQTISVKLNGSADPLILTPLTPGAKSAVLTIKGTITSLSISNSSGQSVNIDIISAN